MDDRVHHLVKPLIFHSHLQLHFRHKIHHIFCAPIQFSVAFLAAEPLDLSHCHSLYADLRERIAYFVN